MLPMCAAYMLLDNQSGKFYVGSSENLEKRLRGHYNMLASRTHHNKNLQILWDDGCQIIVTSYPFKTRGEAYEFEQEIINSNLDNPLMLNIGKGVLGGDNISRNPNKPEIIARMQAITKARHSSLSKEERLARWSQPGEKNGMFGRTHTPEVRARLSELHKGNKIWLGRKHSERAKILLSEHAKKRIGEKNPFFGKKHSDEVRAKISIMNRGNKPTNSTPVCINGVEYPSITEAGRILGIPTPTVLYRIHSKNHKFKDYVFVSKGPTTSESAAME